jgi:phosphopantothenoylcysteine decarboxylase/phosphopantothenate--cysteine ligase
MAPGALMVLFNLDSEKSFDKKKFEKSDPDIIVLNSFDKSPFGETSNDYIIVTGDKRDELKNIDKAVLSMEIFRRLKNMKRDPGDPGMNSLIL